MKKVLCTVLTLIMLFSCCGTAFAATDDDYDHLPQIYVNGIGSRAVYYKDDPEKKSLFYPIDMDKFVGNLSNFDEYAAESVKNMDPNILYNCIYSWMWDTFGMTALDTDGITNLDNVTIDPCPLDYQGNGKYHFNYDSRLDPVDLAHQLHEYVGWVQEHSGSERFELVGSSYGASVLVAYMNEYEQDWKNIDSVLLCVPSLCGVDFVGELFSGNVNIDPDTLEGFLETAVGNEELDLLMSVLNKSNFLDFILQCALEPVLRAALLDAVEAVIHDIFGTFPSMWSFVQDKYFYDALENIYGEDYTDPNHEYAVLIEKITYYHEEVMVKAPEIFKNAVDSGIHFNLICKYGRAPIPLSESGCVMSDGLVDLEDASYGATCSLYGKTLSDDYKQALYPEYSFLSVDGCVDASTGALPFNTWYIKGLEHGQKVSEYHDLLDAVVYNDLDVFTDPDYPQFLQISQTDGESIIPLTASEPEKETSLFEDLIELYKRLFVIIKEKIIELFKA